MANTRIPAPMKATPAVRNHPPITDITPVMRKTALSRPQARSANEVPMATIKVTNVVERGSLSDVPRAIRAPASTRLTDPRIRSKAAPFSIIVSSALKRLLNQRRTLGGVMRSTASATATVLRTSVRAMREEPNISSPPAWLPSPTSVCDTFCAFLEVASETTMMTPAPIRNHSEVFDGPLSDDIRKPL